MTRIIRGPSQDDLYDVASGFYNSPYQHAGSWDYPAYAQNSPYHYHYMPAPQMAEPDIEVWGYHMQLVPEPHLPELPASIDPLPVHPVPIPPPSMQNQPVPAPHMMTDEEFNDIYGFPDDEWINESFVEELAVGPFPVDIPVSTTSSLEGALGPLPGEEPQQPGAAKAAAPAPGNSPATQEEPLDIDDYMALLPLTPLEESPEPEYDVAVEPRRSPRKKVPGPSRIPESVSAMALRSKPTSEVLESISAPVTRAKSRAVLARSLSGLASRKPVSKAGSAKSKPLRRSTRKPRSRKI